jgi:multidrug efflux system outer membrane protein
LESGLAQGSAVAPQTSYSASLSASYEVDLFGRVVRSVKRRARMPRASEASYRSVLLSLQADVAQTYFRLRAPTPNWRPSTRRCACARKACASTSAASTWRHRRIRPDARQDRTVGHAAEAIGLQRQRTNAEHALAVLLGRPAARFTPSTSPLPEGIALPAIPAGLPSTCSNAGPTSPRPSARWKRRTPASAWRARPCSRR